MGTFSIVIGLTLFAAAEAFAKCDDNWLADAEALEFQTLVTVSGRAQTREIAAKNADRVLESAKSLLTRFGVQFKEATLTMTSTEKPRTMKVLEILPAKSTRWNRIAERAKSQLGGLKLYYAPEDLLFYDAHAYYLKAQHFVAVPHSFIVLPVADRATLHELIHAHTVSKVAQGTDEIYAGSVRAIDAETISLKNKGAYSKNMAFDELKAFAHSVFMAGLKLGKKVREGKVSRDDIGELVATISGETDAGAKMAAQTIDIAERALKLLDDNPNAAQISSVPLLGAQVVQYLLTFEGVELKFDFSPGTETTVARKKAQDRLKALIEVSKKLEVAFSAAHAGVAEKLGYVFAEETDLPKLSELARKPRYVVLTN